MHHCRSGTHAAGEYTSGASRPGNTSAGQSSAVNSQTGRSPSAPNAAVVESLPGRELRSSLATPDGVAWHATEHAAEIVSNAIVLATSIFSRPGDWQKLAICPCGNQATAAASGSARASSGSG